WLDASAYPAERAERIKSDFLQSENQAKEVAVFYSIRHGHGTALGDAGVPEKDIAASMHHASRTTTARYLHSDREAVSKAIAVLPDLSYKLPSLATGTDDCLSNACPTGTSRMESGGVGRGFRRVADAVASVEKSEVSAIIGGNPGNGLLAELADAVDSKST